MTTPPSNFLRYLPALYARQSDPFMGQYLNVFQKILTLLDDSELNGRKGIQQLLDADVIGNLFYPRFSFLFPTDHTTFIPPISGAPAATKTALLTQFNSYIDVPVVTAPVNAATSPSPAAPTALTAFQSWLNDFLVWLGRVVDLVVDDAWDIDKKRTVIAQIMALYRLRGTAQGLSFLLNLLLDLPMTVTGYVMNGNTQVAQSGVVSVTVQNPNPPGINVTDTMVAGKTFVVQDTATPTMALVSGYAPWRFDVSVVLPTATNSEMVLYPVSVSAILTLIGKLRLLLDAAKPAATHYRLQVHPSMKLTSQGLSSQLNYNALLGS